MIRSLSSRTTGSAARGVVPRAAAEVHRYTGNVFHEPEKNAPAACVDDRRTFVRSQRSVLGLGACGAYVGNVAPAWYSSSCALNLLIISSCSASSAK